MKENEIRVIGLIFFPFIIFGKKLKRALIIIVLLNQLAVLMEEARFLEAEAVSRESEMNSGSPRRLPSLGFRGNLSRGQREVHASSDSASARGPGGIGSRRRES